MDDNHDVHGHHVPSAAFVSIYGGNLVSKEELHSASAVGRAETVHEQVQKLQQTTLAHHCRLGRAFVLAIGVVGRRAYLGAEFRAAGNQETTGGSAIESHKLKCSE
jgi:acetyltransferase-like isoleucine patch superfamily enzyme